MRSLLSRGRTQLATALAATADTPHGPAEQRIRARRVEACEFLAAADGCTVPASASTGDLPDRLTVRC
ncbi:hypothetical protein [Streptomyces sp. NPDC001100]